MSIEVIYLFVQQDEAAEKIKQDRLKAYNEKKGKKPALIAKSSIVLDVKPWDDETNMEEMEKAVRTIQCEGLLWGVCKYFHSTFKFGTSFSLHLVFKFRFQPNLSPLLTASRSCKSDAWWKTTRFLLIG